MVNFFKKFLRKEPETQGEIFEAGAIGIKDIIAPSSIEVTQNYLKLGEKMAKSFFIFSYPRYLSTAWFSPVINLDTPMDVSFFIHPVDMSQILKRLRKKITEVQSEMMEKEEKGLIRDPVLEIAYRDLEALRDKFQSAQERMFRFGLYLTVYGDTQEELRDTETILRSILEGRLVYIKPALFQQREGFVSTSPYGLDLLQVHTPMNTEPLSSAFPFISFDLSSNEGILYGINQHNNSLILFDRFSLENYNEVFFGVAGSGKSILGSEPVLIKNNNKIQLTKIGPLVEKLIRENGKTQIDEELEGVINPDIEVYSFNKNLKGEWSKVTVAARKKASRYFYRFKTRSGREITTTGDHNMLVLKEGKVIASKSSGVKKGEHIPLPRAISDSNSPLESLNLLELLKNSKGIYVMGGKNLIKTTYKTLKKVVLDKRLHRYLYNYRGGRPIPIHYFWRILDHLKIKSSDSVLRKLKIVSKNGKNRYFLNVNFPIIISLLRLAGYITAEGTIRDKCIMISNNDLEVLKDIDFAFKNLGVPFYYGNRGVISSSRVFVEIVKALGGKGNSKQKKVWPFIFNLEKEKIAQYLAAYFEGDGGLENNGYITAYSKSLRLISEISYLLYYFGIIGRISKKNKKSHQMKRKRTYWCLTISGQENLKKFAENIDFISQRKRRELAQIIEREGNTNVDIIPEISRIFDEIYQIFPPLLYGLPEAGEWRRKERKPSPYHLKEVINKIEEKIQNFKNSASTFKILAELPSLATIINFGENDKNLNRILWQTLGQSWYMMKSWKVKPGSNNVLEAIKVINGNSYSLEKVKSIIHTGFKEMDLPIKYFDRCLQSALVHRPHSDTNYQMLQKAAYYVWQNHQESLNNKIPQIEEKLAQLKILANSDLFWDPIVKIEKFENKKEKYVYDLTVDNEVFLAGRGGIFVHNSYLVKIEILRSLMQNVDVIVLDPENEYKFLSDAVGGSFFNISLASKDRINPFDLPIPREDERPEDVLKSNIMNLVGLLRIMLGGLTPEEDAIIDRALTETYAAKDITPESDFSKITPPLMSDLEQVLETMEGAESLVRRLRKFTQGTYANFFNNYSNISMKNKFVVFGIRDMEEGLRPMAMFIIMRYIWNKIRSELKKRILIVDEAWWLMQTEDGASFLYGLVKRARKYWLGVTTITQDISDFMRSDYGQPIINNSSLKLLMKQSPAVIDSIQKAFNLTEEEKLRLLEAAVGEGVFFAGQKHVAIRVVASYSEDQIITTAPEEVLRIKEAKKRLVEEKE